MRLGLRHSVQIETCLNLVHSALQPLGICAVDPGIAIESRRPVRAAGLGLLGRFGSALRQRRRAPSSGGGATVQRFHISDGSLP